MKNRRNVFDTTNAINSVIKDFPWIKNPREYMALMQGMFIGKSRFMAYIPDSATYPTNYVFSESVRKAYDKVRRQLQTGTTRSPQIQTGFEVGMLYKPMPVSRLIIQNEVSVGEYIRPTELPYKPTALYEMIAEERKLLIIEKMNRIGKDMYGG